ncbi:MAG: YwaF family protein, partial [Clostridia bacterium]|nr:YwaF family protein [Clostridia bacterium]
MGAGFKSVVFRGETLLVKDYIMATVGLKINSPFGEGKELITALSLLLIWANFSAMTLLTAYPFFKGKIKILDGIAKYYCGAVYLLSFAGIGVLVQATEGAGALEVMNSRSVFFALETGFALGLCVYYNVVEYKVKFNLKSLLVGALVVVGMLLASMPPYALQVLKGYGDALIEIKKLTEYHRRFVYAGLILPVAIFLLFFKKDYETKRFVLLYISLAAMHSYSFDITLIKLADITAWPLHLCNTAMFVVPVCLMFKWEKVFYFTFFINVLGAFFAILMPNYDNANLLSYTLVRFWINHYCAFFMPLLTIAFKIYPRPKLKQFTYSIIAFAVYFVIILAIDAAHVDEVNYLFLNTDFVAAKLGPWAENLRLNVLEFGFLGINFKFFPLYQFLYFLVYVLLAFAMWFIYVHFFRLADVYYEIGARNRKIKADKLALEVALAGRS